MEYHGLKIFWTMSVIGGIINMLVIVAAGLRLLEEKKIFLGF